ncbi:MAG TPA: MBOAT family O-acyltransferase, partial [Acidisarcina sp.]
MLFNSPPFLVYFLPACLLGYQIAAHFGRRAVIGWLVLASLVFYAYWNPSFVIVLITSMLVNFAVSKAIAAAGEQNKTRWMIVGVTLNLAGLCYFKYLFPTIKFLASFGAGHHSIREVLLPLGISFFTFTQIAYLVDLSQGEATEQNFLEYALFVTFFPHLIAGPILHHREIMPQFSEDRSYKLNPDDLMVGISWFVMGMAKKTLIADKLALVAAPAFDYVAYRSPLEAWVGVVCYSLQLYFDFSGYSDMAIG